MSAHLSDTGETPLWREYLELTKPRVVALLVFTALVGMLLAVPGAVPFRVLFYGNLGIALAAAGAAAINHVVDRRIDAVMARTHARPVPTGQIESRDALMFAFGLSAASMLVLVVFINVLTAVLTFVSLIGYAVIYTMYLKHATPQNIVIGGAAGAAPPLLRWTAATGSVDPGALMLFLIIFIWTPPHFWALAIARKDDYANARVPMLPVTHGDAFTRTHVLLYTLLLLAATLLPFATGMSGGFYLGGALALNAGFLYYAWKLKFDSDPKLPMQTFGYSIIYLTALFAYLLIDHYLAH